MASCRDAEGELQYHSTDTTIPVRMNNPQTFLVNGKNESLSPFDRGFAYGDGVFRTFPVKEGQPECWELHYAKLEEDCNVLGIVCPNSEVLLSDISRLFQDNETAVVKIIITRGSGARGYAVPALAQPTRVVLRTSCPDYPPYYFDEGVNLHLCNIRLAHQPKLAGIKHLNRLENVLARMEWTDSSIADGLLLDNRNCVVECTMSNIFARFDRTLLTPDLSHCGVAGVTRQRILEMAPRLGYRTEISELPMSRFMQAEEVVICNSLLGAVQVRSCNRQEWPKVNLAGNLRKLLGLGQ